MWDGVIPLVGDMYATVTQLATKLDISAAPFYRGSFNNWSEVPSQPSAYMVDEYGNRTPLKNDYMIVLSADDFREHDRLLGTWRFTYNGTWDSLGISGWVPQYRVNEGPFSDSQMSAIDSGITQAKVAKYEGYETGK